jgi:hypothetical protein
MNTSGFHAEFKTGVDIRPERSHVFIITFAITSALCLFVGFYFLWHKPSYSWVPIVIGISFAIISFLAWNKSHKNIDLANAHPTTIYDQKSGLQFTTDTRALTSPEPIQALERLFTSLSHRIPLPEPDGLVDSSGAPLPDKKQEAIMQIKNINESTEKMTKEAISFIVGASNGEVIEQPLLQEPGDDILIKTNAPISNC